MLKLWFLILLSINLILVASSIFISDGIEIFRFTKSKNASDEFDFEYRVENNETFRGQTYQLVEGIRFMFGKDSNVFWVELTRNDLEKAKTKPILQSVRLVLVVPEEDIATFRDDFKEYILTISTGDLYIPLYATEWNLHNVCYQKSKKDPKTFDFTISSDNNSRQFNGTTYIQTTDPHVQRLHLVDIPQRNGTYEVEFSDVELKSTEIFCKETKTIQHSGSLGDGSGKVTNAKLLERLNDESSAI